MVSLEKSHCFTEQAGPETPGCSEFNAFRAKVDDNGQGVPMDVQVEVHFTVQHTLDELKDVFVKRGHFPGWKVIQDTDTRPQLFFETRIVSINLSSEADRFAWFVFSLEACGELRKTVVINNVVPSGVNIDIPNLTDFLNFCRNCLVGTPGGA
jgi:hypothetical protein